MPTQKFDRRLTEEIEKRKEKSAARKAVADEAKIDVIIEHSRRTVTPPTTKASAQTKSRQERVSELKEAALKSQGPIVEELVSLGVKRGKIKQLWMGNALATELTVDQIEKIAKLSSVKIIRLSKLDKVTCLNQSVPLIGANQVWNMGSTGMGVKVAVLDSGIDTNHPALRAKVVLEFNKTTESQSTSGNHATHVAGIIASDDNTYKGVAPGAKLINGKVLTASGAGRPEDVVAGIAQAVNSGADVINLSLGWSHPLHQWYCPNGDCILCQAIDDAVKLGVIVVVAAGNEGTNQGADTNIRCPGNARGAITVGAMDKSDRLASFSSIGPTPYGAVKPDVSAPGVSIKSAFTNGFWGVLSGTSMAAPHVAGLAALLLEKHSHLINEDVKHLLTTTALDKHYGENEQGSGRADAVAEARYFDPASGTVDVYVRDHVHDGGEVPAGDPWWQSPDIWAQLVRTGEEIYGVVEPHTRPEYGQPSYLYVRVHNRGSSLADPVTVYLGSTGFSTSPSGWQLINQITTRNLLPGQTRIVGPFVWLAPRTGHGCLKVGLDYAQHPLPANWMNVDVRQNNNLAQRNIEVADLFPSGMARTEFYVNGLEGASSVAALEVDRSRFPQDGEIKLTLVRRFVDSGQVLTGITLGEMTELRARLDVIGNVGSIENIYLQSRERSKVVMSTKLPDTVGVGTVYPVVVTQKIDGTVVGRISFLVSVTNPAASPFVANTRPRSKEVHQVGKCFWEKLIKVENRLPVRSLEELMQRGFPAAGKFNGCKYCLPDYHID